MNVLLSFELLYKCVYFILYIMFYHVQRIEPFVIYYYYYYYCAPNLDNLIKGKSVIDKSVCVTSGLYN